MSDSNADKVVIIATHGPEDPERATLPFVMATAAQVMDEKDKSEAIETKKKPRGQQTLPVEREAGQD